MTRSGLQQRSMGRTRGTPVGRPSRGAGHCALLMVGFAAFLGAAGGAGAAVRQLAELSLEQLRDVVVTTVSRRPEQLQTAAASVYVISAEDIRRSGATTLPEALRLAPTLSIARADANQYAISARGFNNVLANKMLVLIDGRTVYTPLFSGVFWEAQGLMLDTVERIEVITGPSTALWGSNAVNGLIHVITRGAADTPGWAGTASLGSRQHSAALRLGVPAGDGHLRFYATGHHRDSTRRADGSSVNDEADGVQAGFRGDWSAAGASFTLLGDLSSGRIDQGQVRRSYSGGHLLARWERALAHGASAALQVYLERTEREHPQIFAETLDTADIVAQYSVQAAAGHRVLLGAGYRHARDRVARLPALAFVPGTRSMAWGRLFVQDEIAVNPRWALTLAASLETNPFTGTEFLPSVRLAWQPDSRQLVWAALARAVRAPSRVDREFFQPAQPPYLIAGGPDFRSETSDTLELGLRAQPHTALSYSLTAFHHRHRHLRSLAPSANGLQFENGYQGWSRGLEAWARWRVTDGWRLDSGAQLLRQRLRLRPGAIDVGGVQALGNDPRYGFILRSMLDLTPHHTWDLSLRRVGALPQPRVPGYTALDTRLAWQPTRALELAVVVQNLLGARHTEWGPAPNRVVLDRELLLQVRWRL